ncbi:hypothetical protein BC831DRAFT_453376 [Entophlyctis helioformis]|nr:hypothetical protein BC831DRAFT_453376 [Entophlyctis helioformis]
MSTSIMAARIVSICAMSIMAACRASFWNVSLCAVAACVSSCSLAALVCSTLRVQVRWIVICMTVTIQEWMACFVACGCTIMLSART